MDPAALRLSYQARALRALQVLCPSSDLAVFSSPLLVLVLALHAFLVLLLHLDELGGVIGAATHPSAWIVLFLDFLDLGGEHAGGIFETRRLRGAGGAVVLQIVVVRTWVVLLRAGSRGQLYCAFAVVRRPLWLRKVDFVRIICSRIDLLDLQSCMRLRVKSSSVRLLRGQMLHALRRGSWHPLPEAAVPQLLGLLLFRIFEPVLFLGKGTAANRWLGWLTGRYFHFIEVNPLPSVQRL